MEIGEIFSDALVYPFHNIKALVIYLVLGIILGIAVGGTIAGMAAGILAENILAVIGSGIIGIIIAFVLGFIITGYELDIVKFGIERDPSSPGIDIVRQFINGVKYFVVYIVYMIVPIIISAILAVVFQHWLSSIISAIVSIVFALALMMGQCRLAKTEDLGYALAIGDAIGDISRVGIVKLALFIILMFIIVFAVFFVALIITRWNSTVGGILMGIVGIYISFVIARATGLLYSDV
ncbi:DUF4013 domain-containing protein [Methanobrevibacter sp.]|uniref:DUF4013 domain-containing protein n=1 Tax=Methanobrevibacter sp. TaxID=66852 RepID=UPI003863B3B1